MPNCVICNTPNSGSHNDGTGGDLVNCPGCGSYRCVLDELTDLKKENPDFMPRLSHRLRRMQTDRPVLLTYERIRELVADPLPSVREQQESLLLAIGDKLREGNPTGFYEITASVAPFLTSWIGAFDRNSLFEILAQMRDAHLIEWKNEVSRNYVWAYPSGWDRYEEIKMAPSQARLAFMAMPFENSELDLVYNECFKNAVKETGFTLRRVDERQPAGLIDDQIRVRIRAARFLDRRAYDRKSRSLLGSWFRGRSRATSNIHLQEGS